MFSLGTIVRSSIFSICQEHPIHAPKTGGNHWSCTFPPAMGCQLQLHEGIFSAIRCSSSFQVSQIFLKYFQGRTSTRAAMPQSPCLCEGHAADVPDDWSVDSLFGIFGFLVSKSHQHESPSRLLNLSQYVLSQRSPKVLLLQATHLPQFQVPGSL